MGHSSTAARATDLPTVAEAKNDPDVAAVPVAVPDPHYDEAVADLEQALSAGRAQLDPGTVKILEANLAAIDKAIEQSRQCSRLATDPANLCIFTATSRRPVSASSRCSAAAARIC